MPSIEINGTKIEAEAGAMIIEVADNRNIQIPRFCYHKKLSIAANCRMCLVEVERAPKPVPACATPITEGMKIWTRSPKVLQAQKGVMEFLLINHPLDCPICDQGGECELQDLSMGYGSAVSRYAEEKRIVHDKNLGPLIATDLTRCIHCTRCVRFGSEVAGIRELGATGRGEHTEIGTYIERSVASEVSGNIIDLCPVGAITSKPFRFTARGWELTQAPTIAPHDCIGSHIYTHTRRGVVMRVVPKENESINEIWISDRDRFSYEGLYHPDRLAAPKIKQDGVWRTVDWETALQYTVNGLMKVIAKRSPDAIGGMLSPNATLEEGFLFQKWLRGLGIDNIDHRLRQTDFRHQSEWPRFPNLGVPIAEIEQQSVVLLVGSNIRKEQPILAIKLRKMTLYGGKVWALNPLDCPFNFDLEFKKIVDGGDLVKGLCSIAKALLTIQKMPASVPAGVLEGLGSVVAEDIDIEMAKRLLLAEKKLILIGALAMSHPEFSKIIALIGWISELSGAKFGILTDGANSAGAWVAGCVPHRLPGGKSIEKSLGLTIPEMFQKALCAYILFNVEPHLDCMDAKGALHALKAADYVVAITPFEDERLRDTADVLLPMTPFTETAGTFVNIEGQWQSFHPVTEPFENSRPGWQILAELGRLCGIFGGYESLETVLESLKSEIKETIASDLVFKAHWPSTDPLKSFQEHNEIIRIAPVPLYATDGLVRRAKSLQSTQDAGSNAVHLNHALASRLGLLDANEAQVSSADDCLILPLVIDDTVPDHSAMIFSGMEATILLGGAYCPVKLSRVKEQRTVG